MPDDDEFSWGEPLFDWPVPEPPRMRAPAPAIRFSRFRPRTRTLCAICIRQIHHYGTDAVPPPAPVRWHYHKGSLTESICERHKIEMEEGRLPDG